MATDQDAAIRPEQYTVPPGPPPAARGVWPLRAALFAATALFVPFAVSAWLFLRLPPSGTPLAQLGWRVARVDAPLVVAIEPGARHAWMLFEPFTAPHVRVLQACRVELASARAVRCERLARSTDDTSLVDFRHAVGRDSLLVVAKRMGTSPFGFRAMLARPGGGVVAWDLAHPFASGGYNESPDVVGLASDGGGGFVVHAGASSRGRLPLAQLRIGARGEHGAWEPRDHELAATELGETLFATADPKRIIAKVDGDIVVDVQGHAEPLHVPDCASSLASACLSADWLESYAGLVRDRTAWLDGTGRLVPFASVAAPRPRPGEYGDGWRVVELLRADGGSDPFFVRRIQPADGEPGYYRTETRLLTGERVALRTVVRGSEGVLLARVGRGPERRVARAEHELDEWNVVPSAHGLIAIEPGRGRAVVLDREMRRVDRRPTFAGVWEIARHRYELDGSATFLYLALLASFPLLAGLAFVSLRRARRAAREPGGAVVIALYVYAAFGVIVLVPNYRYLFAP